jgi:hypothetical protein
MRRDDNGEYHVGRPGVMPYGANLMISQPFGVWS